MWRSICLILLAFSGPAQCLQSCYTCGDSWQSQTACNKTAQSVECPDSEQFICASSVRNEDGTPEVRKHCLERNTCYSTEAVNPPDCISGQISQGITCLFCCESQNNCNWDRIEFKPEHSEGFDGDCVSDCTGLPDGNYQSCKYCDQYVTCSSGILYQMDCPADLVWDAVHKRCGWTSQTCDGWKPSRCVSDCTNKADGPFQSCRACHGLSMCSNGKIHYMKCPSPTVWDDNTKRCEWSSKTCKECNRSCRGLPDGYYHSCNGCSWFKMCKGGAMAEQQCPVGKSWDDHLKTCTWTSATCT